MNGIIILIWSGIILCIPLTLLVLDSKPVNKFRICKKGKFDYYRVEQLHQFLFFKKWESLSGEYDTIEKVKIELERRKKLNELQIAKWEEIKE